jgi:hypothetical protein
MRKKIEFERLYTYIDLFLLDSRDFCTEEAVALDRARVSLANLGNKFAARFTFSRLYDCTTCELVPIFSSAIDNLNNATENLKRAAEIETRNIARLKAIMDNEPNKQIERNEEDDLSLFIDRLFCQWKPETGSIAYRKAIRIAFDPATPDNIATQFATVLRNAKDGADRVGQSVTLFAYFSVNTDGTLTFDSPIEYKAKANRVQLEDVLTGKFKVTHYENIYVGHLPKQKLREALKQVRAGNTDLFKFKK